MKLQAEMIGKDGAGVQLRLTPTEASVLAEYLKEVKTSKAQRHVLNPARLADLLTTLSGWLTKGVEHG